MKKYFSIEYLYLYYYLLLMLGLVLYDNANSSPSTSIRMLYLLALVIPVFQRKEYLPVVLLCAWTITKSSYSQPFIPADYRIYIAIMILFAVSNNRKIPINAIFVVIVLHVFLNSLAIQGSISKRLPYPLLECFVLFFCIKRDSIKLNSALLPFVFMVTSLAIAYWLFFCENAKLQVAHHVEDMEVEGWMDPNYLSGIVGMGCIVAINELMTRAKNIYIRLFFIFTICITLYTSAFLASRGGMLAISVSVLVLFLMSNAKSKTKILVVSISLIIVTVLYYRGAFDLIMARIDMGEGDLSNGRFEIWQRKLSSFMMEGNFMNWFLGFGEKGAGLLGGYSFIRGSHNDFIAILCSYGILGLCLFIASLIYPIKISGKMMKSTIVSYIVYLSVVCMSLEPISLGYIPYLAFYFFVVIQAHYSLQVQQNAIK